MTPTFAVLKIEVADGEVELILCFRVTVPLVAFEGEDVVRLLFDDGNDVGECLGVWDTVGHFDSFAQPIDLKFAKILTVGEAVHAAKHRADGHEEHFAEMMQLVAVRARVFDD